MTTFNTSCMGLPMAVAHLASHACKSGQFSVRLREYIPHRSCVLNRLGQIYFHQGAEKTLGKSLAQGRVRYHMSKHQSLGYQKRGESLGLFSPETLGCVSSKSVWVRERLERFPLNLGSVQLSATRL